MAKKALSIGINYPGSDIEFQGCVNDSRMIEKLLRDHYGFEDITLLLDNDATTANMRAALHDLVKGAKPGDVLFFHYSGHGSQLPDKANDDDFEPDGLDEILCPVDLDWNTKVIRDDELKAIFDSVPNGVNLTVFLDCCNSGGGIDQLNEYQSLPPAARSAEKPHRKWRATNRYLKPPTDVIEFAASRKLPFKARSVSRKVDHSALMISGCQANQTSADAYIRGTYRGAATYYLDKTLRELGYSSSYVDVVDKLNKDIAAAGFTQRPQLDGSEKLHEEAFLSDYRDLFAATVEPTPEVQVVSPIIEAPKKKKDNSMMIIVVIALIAAAIAFVSTS